MIRAHQREPVPSASVAIIGPRLAAAVIGPAAVVERNEERAVFDRVMGVSLQIC